MRPVALIAMLAACEVRAADPWWGPDKALHASVSAGIASGSYAIVAITSEERPTRWLMAFGLSLGAGIAKETFDSWGLGQPSMKDLMWDIAGAALGATLAWVVDVLVLRPLGEALGATSAL